MSPINTGFVGPAVATALTVYGIETVVPLLIQRNILLLQQHLPFTVLKHNGTTEDIDGGLKVATALTVYGIETKAL